MDLSFPIGGVTTLLGQQEEEKIPPYPVTAHPVTDCHNSASESTVTVLRTFSFLQETPKSIKEGSLLCFSWVCMWSTIRLQVLNCYFLLLPNKPILLEKYLAICLGSTMSVADCHF